MADTFKDPETNAIPKQNGIRISLPAVLCSESPSTSDPSDSSTATMKTLASSESKLSLPSNLCTPTSPLTLSSPLSLPTSPTPFLKSNLSVHKPVTSATQLTAPATGVSPNVTKSSDSPNLHSGSATGNPRNKCALQPGHSLMDWIRLGNSGKDLTGIGGRIRAVSPKELAAHNTPNDAWLAIRGRVYNVTHYLPYHPGGAEELMKGAGIDATQLFDKVHPWVNYDSLLSKCLIGPLRIDRPDAEELFGSPNPSIKSDRLREPSKAQELVRKSMENLANCITPVKKKINAKSEENVKCIPNPSKIMQSLIYSSELPVSISRRAGSSLSKSDLKTNKDPSPLRFDWIQTSTKLTLSVYTGPLANPGVCARLFDDVLLLEVATDGFLRHLKLVPEQRLKQPISLRVFAESGKIEVCVLKAEPSIWQGCGEATASEASPVSSPRSMECVVRCRSVVSHDTAMLSLSPRLGAVVVPLGYHVRVHYKIEDTDHVRSYTPVGEGWDEPMDIQDGGTLLKLAVKGYTHGIVSSRLSALNADDVVTMSGTYGNFKLNKLKSVKTLNLVAAGTGITPMLGLLRFMLGRTNPKCERVNLLFFNKKEEDILFRRKFEEFSKEDNRFMVTNVLSEAGSAWSGRSGRVCVPHLTTALSELRCTEQLCTAFTCVCGPSEFTQVTLEMLTKLGMREGCLHAFLG